MKNIITLLVLVSTTAVFSQKTINASDILRDIKDGKAIHISNATIEGVLDFTYMDEALAKLPSKKKKKSWFNWGNNNYSNEIKKVIENKVSFVNCVFKEDVLAYIPDEVSGYTFTADFDDAAIFKNCTFKRKAMFKYSNFERDADFSGSKFLDDSTFKYAKFYRAISFANTQFDEPATFKYSEFRQKVNFSNAIFRESATFKYTKFKNGVSFNNTKFKEDLDLKYTKVTGDFDIKNMEVAYDIDSKYTSINGKSFSKYVLKSKE